MKRRKQSKTIPRRELLRFAGLSAGAAGVTAAALSGGPAKAAELSEAGSGKTGYRETGHILKYYESTRY
ncbi:MAG: hypothetical protein QGI06_10950 [Rhodospirillales bacterium]|nr:hypothetical protein [Rhodospirillales bacterium]